MPIINKLFATYRAKGFEISSGLNPCHMDNDAAAPFTCLFKDGVPYTNGLGIALQEIYFLECLFDGYQPKKIFLIGNSFGWSTIAIGLLNREAQVVALDSGGDPKSIEGLEMTNDIGRELGLNVKAVKGISPTDVEEVVFKELGGEIDFCFIDGLHTNEQIVLDHDAVQPFLNEDGVILFHDAISCGMEPGIANIAKKTSGKIDYLQATSSGMAILHSGTNKQIEATLATFSYDDKLLDTMRQKNRQEKHRHLYRWKRSLDKRTKALTGLFSSKA